MSTKAMIAQAVHFCANAHSGQVDKCGFPYALHSMAVADKVRPWAARYCETEEEELRAVVVALLHDVVEDTDVTVDTIRTMFNRRVACGVRRMTKVEGQSNQDYMLEVSGSRTSAVVKLADMEHNSADYRVHYLPLKQQCYNGRVYAAQKWFLLAVLETKPGTPERREMVKGIYK